MFELIRADARRYQDERGWLLHPGFWAGTVYRFGSWACGVRFAPLRVLLLALHAVLDFPWKFVRAVTLPPRARIGGGLCLEHPQNIVLAPSVVIGENCTIYHEVTLGRGPLPGVPHLGHRVRLFPGAKLLGGIAIGDGADVGANAVVTRDVPAHSIVVAPPARVVPAAMVERWEQLEARAAAGDGSGPCQAH